MPSERRQLQVGVQGPWVAAEVFAGPELQRVDEDGHHDHRTVHPSGCPHQREVTVVKGTHRRHQHDPPAGVAQSAAHLGDGLRRLVDVQLTGMELLL